LPALHALSFGIDETSLYARYTSKAMNLWPRGASHWRQSKNPWRGSFGDWHCAIASTGYRI